MEVVFYLLIEKHIQIIVEDVLDKFIPIVYQ